jgi:hypothetical protein
MHLKIYLKLKGKGKDVLFARTANRNISYAIECFGDIDINQIKPIDAGKYRDFFLKKDYRLLQFGEFSLLLVQCLTLV